jgi:deoxyadenosine/deoxycytidine kinase
MSNIYTIVSIEGNIGSGKSTLLSNLCKYYENNSNVVFLKEPIDEWDKIKDENGVTILNKFYADQEKYSFPFQMMAYISRLKLFRNTLKNIKYVGEGKSKNIVIITERSLYTDKMVFAKMLYDSKKIEDVCYQIYLNWFDIFSDEFTVHKVVYIKTSPEKCHERITKRLRIGEENIPLEYLDNCSNYHDNMLDKESPECVCKVQLILDGNIDIYKNTNQVEEFIDKIDKFIKM